MTQVIGRYQITTHDDSFHGNPPRGKKWFLLDTHENDRHVYGAYQSGDAPAMKCPGVVSLIELRNRLNAKWAKTLRIVQCQ